MIMMQGNDRIFDKVITEGGTAAARTISLYGVKALSDLQGVSLIVRANIGGSNSATTMKVNNLAATKLSVFKNGGIADADANWIVSGQLYMLYYDGVQFIAFPMSASSGSSSSSVEFADFPINVLNLTTQSSETDISSAFGGAAKTAEFDALVQAGTKIIRFTNVDSFVYYTAIYYKHINAENSTINDIVVVLHNYTDRTNLEMFTFLGTMTEDGDFEKYTAVVKETLYSSSQEGTLNNPRAFTGDANTKTTPGVYAITPFSNVPKNIPSGVSYGTMIVTTDEDASTITQTLQTSNTVYFRCKYSTNSWGEWVDLGASGGMKTFEITYDDLEDILNAKSESAILAIWNDAEQGEFVEAMNDPNIIIVIKYTDDQYITDRQYVVYKTGFYNGIGYSVAQTQYINLITVTGSYLYNYKFNFNFDTEHISSVTRSSIDLSKIEDEMIVETDQATSLSFDNQTGNRGILAVSGNQRQETREGYNLLDMRDAKGGTSGGITVTINEDGSYKYVGTATSNVINVWLKGSFFGTTPLFTLKAGKKYYIKDVLLYSLKTPIVTTGGAITPSSDIDVTAVRAPDATTGNTYDKTCYPMITKNEEKPWQPYGAMPSPEFPSKIETVGDDVNLFNKDEVVLKDGYYSSVDGSFVTSTTTCHTENFIKVIPNTDYILSGFKRHSSSYNYPSIYAIYFYDNEKNWISRTSAFYTSNSAPINEYLEYQFKTPSGCRYIRFQCQTTEINLDLDTIKLQEGTIATAYSKFGQGSVSVTVCNKNLFDKNNYIKIIQGQFTSTGEFNNDSRHRTVLIRCKGNLELSVYMKNANKYASGTLVCFSEMPNPGVTMPIKISNRPNALNIVTPAETKYLAIYLGATFQENWTSTQDVIDSIMLVEGTVDLTSKDYVEHQEQNFTMPVQREMLTEDYFVKEADGWKEVHNKPELTLDGSDDEEWVLSGAFSNVFVCNKPADLIGYETDLICNITDNFVTNGETLNSLEHGIAVGSKINIKLAKINTLEELKQYLSTTNIKLYYKSTQETKLPCTEEQSAVLDELNNLDLFDGVNNIITAEDIALLQMTLVDSQLNDVIEASIPIVNSASTTTPKANGTAAVGTDTKFARGDHVHPAQTTITGNAGSATKLQTARTINGAAFNGTANINTFDSSYKVPGCYRMKSDSNPEINLPGGNNFIPLENFPMYSELGTNPLFTLNSDGTITVNKTCMLDFRGTWSVYGSGNTQNKIYSNITYYDSDMQGWMPLYSSPLVPTSTMEMTSYDADFGPGQMGMVMAGTKIRASLDSTNDTSGAVFSGQILGYSLFINVIYVKG